MSAFLGKVHYWLFNKILWFEILEGKILEIAKEENIDINILIEETEKKYGGKLPQKPLEDLIDHQNIHGWLQDKIHSAEGRMAAYTKAILNEDSFAIDKLKAVYFMQGKEAAKEVKETKGEVNSAENIYSEMNNYILDGMPCDRVNEILELGDECATWKRKTCVHKDIWEKEDIPVNVFYTLRDEWIKAFVENVNEKFIYKIYEDNMFTIKIKK